MVAEAVARAKGTIRRDSVWPLAFTSFQMSLPPQSVQGLVARTQGSQDALCPLAPGFREVLLREQKTPWLFPSPPWKATKFKVNH